MRDVDAIGDRVVVDHDRQPASSGNCLNMRQGLFGAGFVGDARQYHEAAGASLRRSLCCRRATLRRALADRHQHRLRTCGGAGHLQNFELLFRLQRHILAKRAADDDAVHARVGLQSEAALHFGKIKFAVLQ